MRGKRSLRERLPDMAGGVAFTIPVNMIPKLRKARKQAERDIGHTVPFADAVKYLNHCIWKNRCLGKDIGYLPILYRFELPMLVAMEEITRSSHIYQQSCTKEVIEYV